MNIKILYGGEVFSENIFRGDIESQSDVFLQLKVMFKMFFFMYFLLLSSISVFYVYI